MDFIVEQFFDLSIMAQVFPLLLKGLLVTLQICLVIIPIGLCTGLGTAVLATSRIRLVRLAVAVFVDIFRALPPLVLLIFAYSGLPFFGIRLSPFTAVCLALILSMTSYFCEVFRAGLESVGTGQREAAAVGQCDSRLVDPSTHDVHCGRPDEARDEAACGSAVHIGRRADLLHPAGIHHHDAIGERHGLDLVVGDVERRGREPRVQFAQLDPHLRAQLGVEVRQRLVEEEHLGIADDGTTHRDALALAARELARTPPQQVAQAQDVGGAVHPGRDLGPGHAADPQPVGHVLEHGHVRIERVVLEHHCHVALAGLEAADVAIADMDAAARERLQAGDAAQQRGLAAAGRADDDDELAVGDLEVDRLDRHLGPVELAHAAQCHLRHRLDPCAISRSRPRP